MTVDDVLSDCITVRALTGFHRPAFLPWLRDRFRHGCLCLRESLHARVYTTSSLDLRSHGGTHSLERIHIGDRTRSDFSAPSSTAAASAGCCSPRSTRATDSDCSCCICRPPKDDEVGCRVKVLAILSA